MSLRIICEIRLKLSHIKWSLNDYKERRRRRLKFIESFFIFAFFSPLAFFLSLRTWHGKSDERRLHRIIIKFPPPPPFFAFWNCCNILLSFGLYLGLLGPSPKEKENIKKQRNLMNKAMEKNLFFTDCRSPKRLGKRKKSCYWHLPPKLANYYRHSDPN